MCSFALFLQKLKIAQKKDIQNLSQLFKRLVYPHTFLSRFYKVIPSKNTFISTSKTLHNPIKSLTCTLTRLHSICE